MLRINDLLNLLKNDNAELNFENSFKLAQMCSSLIKENNIEANSIAIRVLDNWNKINEATKDIWADIIETIGFYPYLNNENVSKYFKNLSGEIRNGKHLSSKLINKYLHEEQLDLLKIIESEKNLILSAPTSFGKSLLIEEIVASYNFKNLIVIQPTLALIDETRRKLIKYNYKLIVKTTQKPSREIGNIFLFTAERVNEYLHFPKIEFLIIDEFYKLSGKRDDERSSSLNNAFHLLLKKFNPKFYLLGPNIDNISEGFIEKHNAIFYKTNFSLVGNEVVNIYEDYNNQFGTRGKKKNFKEKILFDLLFELKNEQTIIYCSSPNRVRNLAKSFSEYLLVKEIEELNDDEIPLIEWILNNIELNWSLTNLLRLGIGIHDGALQKHITTSIIDYFNDCKLNFLFCTTTIIEGVNTNAKNIIYFDSTKGNNTNIDFFDYSNIKGRAGRMMKHYIGIIYNFNPPPLNEPIDIDIPFFQQNPIKDEVLIQLDDNEIIDKQCSQYINIKNIPGSERELIKKNGVSVHGQKAIIEKLRNDIDNSYNLIYWEGQPKYNQLEYVLSLGWNYLLVEGESTKPMTLSFIVNRTFNYGLHQNINNLVIDNYNYKLQTKPQDDNATNMDNAIRETFQLMKHWFEYKIPKWLSVLNELQKFVCIEKGLKPGNYMYYSNLIENDFLDENSAILIEYGVPNSAIRKLQKLLPKTINQDNILDFIKKNRLYENPSLIKYESLKLSENL